MLFEAWRRPVANVKQSRRYLSRFSAPVVRQRIYHRAPARSWNRLTILFYSSIISTAAAADASVKRRRRKQWDLAIAEVERSLQRPLSRGLHVESSSPRDQVAKHEGQMAQAKDDVGGDDMQQESLTRSLEAVPTSDGPVERKLLRTPKVLHAADYPFATQDLFAVSMAKVQETARVSLTSIYASDMRRTWRKAEPWVPKKHVRVEYSIAKLATRLLLEAMGDDAVDVQASQLLKTTLREVSHRLEQLHNAGAHDLQGLQRLQYPQFDQDQSPTDVNNKELIKSLAITIKGYSEGRVTYTSMLRKIAYDLLASSVPPTIITYSLLISRFSRLEHSHLVDMIIESNSECCIRPDEMLVSAVLTHYVRKRNFGSFHTYVRKIQGLDGSLMLARPGLPLDGVGASRLHQVDGKIYQAMTIDPVLMHQIIRGYLAFGREETAADWVRIMQERGIRPHLRLLCAFLRYYAYTSKWEPGSAIWRTMTTQFLLAPDREQFTRQDEAIAFCSALQLCKACGKPKAFRAIYEKGLSRGIRMDKLLRPPSVRRGFSWLEDVAATRSRAIRILEHRVTMLIQDNQTWALHLLASKMLFSGFTTVDMKKMFRRIGTEGTSEGWFGTRPWLSTSREWAPAISTHGRAKTVSFSPSDGV